MCSRFKAFDTLAVSGVQTLSPYQPGKPESALKREYGIEHIVKLASNENPLGCSSQVAAAISEVLADLTRYPDGAGFALKAALAAYHRIDASMITLGNGSSEVIELLARVFVAPSDEVVFSQHAFAMYPLITQAVGGISVEVPACDWGHDLDAMLAAINSKTRMVFVANPNNPTGTWLDADTLYGFIKAVPEKVVVVVDEAYFEYANDPQMEADDYPDASQWLAEFPNLVVTRTFSKAYGLAGLRAGYSLSSLTIADLMNRIRPPFNMNMPAQIGALTALSDREYLKQSLSVNVLGMSQLTNAFQAMGLSFIPSIGNFVCVEVGDDAGVVYDALLRRGVIVRPVANYGMPRHLRVSVGTKKENAYFLVQLAEVLGK